MQILNNLLCRQQLQLDLNVNIILINVISNGNFIEIFEFPFTYIKCLYCKSIINCSTWICCILLDSRNWSRYHNCIQTFEHISAQAYITYDKYFVELNI